MDSYSIIITPDIESAFKANNKLTEILLFKDRYRK